MTLKTCKGWQPQIVKPAAGWDENVGSEAGGAELTAVFAAASFSFRLIDEEGAGAAAGAPSEAEVMEVKDGAVGTLEEAAATAEGFEATAAPSVKPAAGWDENVGSEAGGAELTSEGTMPLNLAFDVCFCNMNS
jgi:hypothetical protein